MHRIGLFLLVLVSVACSGRATFQIYTSSQTETCTPVGAIRRYVSSEIRIPGSATEFAADFDNDGRKENLLASLGQTYSRVATLGGTMGELINRNGISIGQGLVLFEVQASDTEPGCASVAVGVGRSPQGTTPKFDGTDQLKIELGHRLVTIPAQGTQSQLETTPYSRMNTRSMRRLDLLFPVRSTVLHLRLYGPYVTISKISDQQIEGQINGVVFKDEIDPTFTPFLAREMTSVLNENPDSADLKRNIPYVEVPTAPASMKKCQIAERCCRSNPMTCKFTPAEVGTLLLTSHFADPDVQVFDGKQWDPVPNGSAKNGFSVGIGFRAVAADFTPSCASGTFCPEPQLSFSSTGAGWASRLSDAWLTLSDGSFMHFDGLSWKKEYQDPMMAAPWGMGGRTYADAWTSGTEGMLHWDGAFFTATPAPQAVTFRTFVPDGEQGFLAAAADSGPPNKGGIFQFDGNTWSGIPGYDQQYSSAISLPSGEAWAVGPNGRFARRSGGSWGPPPVLPDIGAYDYRTLYGSASDNVWALGTQAGLKGACFRFDGKAWSKTNACQNLLTPIRTVWASSPDDIWAGGEDGHVARYRPEHDPEQWEVLTVRANTPPTHSALIFGAERDVVWMPIRSVGLMRYQP